MGKPLKKSLPKKAPPKKRVPVPSAHERGALPSKSKSGCKHRGPCFRVDLFKFKEGDLGGQDTFHWMDEAGAVSFGMRESRNRDLRARVYGPDRKLIVAFEPRTYDVQAARHALLDYNEWQQLHRDVWGDVVAARKERDPSLYPGAKSIGKTATITPKKKPVAKKALTKKKSLKR